MESHLKIIDELLNDYVVDESVLGVVQIGSTAKGYADEHSDIDIEVIVTEERYDKLAAKFQKSVHDTEYDLIISTINRLRQVKDSKEDEDHWCYQNC